MPEKSIAHAPERSRYELKLDGEVVGVADYKQDAKVRSFTHTGVEPAHRGQGLAAELIDFALRETQEAELEVLPYCWYVRDHIAKNPQYLELVPGESRAGFGLGATRLAKS
ncbi:MAG TPA: GNAT family N-acetyltransferase [Solirubrobacterales bacterium]|nr:GNAT family N-acetyltransferase [Solirubrobacterales bacterium]